MGSGGWKIIIKIHRKFCKNAVYILGNCEVKIIEAKIRNVKLKSREEEEEEEELGYNIYYQVK